jgi:hypothetical protein
VERVHISYRRASWAERRRRFALPTPRKCASRKLALSCLHLLGFDKPAVSEARSGPGKAAVTAYRHLCGRRPCGPQLWLSRRRCRR